MKMLPFRLLMVFCFLHGFVSLAQTNISLDVNFQKAYFYKINSAQASVLFKHPEKNPDSTWFSHVAYAQTSSSDSLPLEQSNYIKTYLVNNRFTYQYVPVTFWRVLILAPRYNHFSLQIQDIRTGIPIEVNKVVFDGNNLHYDLKTKSYIAKRYANYGVLAITDKDETFYYFISERKNFYNFLQQKYNRILNKSPLSYIAGLYRLYNRSLVDAIALMNGRKNSEGVFNEPQKLATSFWNECKHTPGDKSYNTYIYFNKPKYRENDTIKFKAHILSNFNKGKWYDKPVKVFLDERDENIYLGKAYSKGKGAGYDFQFVILDSMDIYIDDDYEITIRDLDSNKLGTERFTYEDYELKKSVFEISLPDGKSQYKNEPFAVHFTAKDDNGLPMPGTRATITALTRRIENVKPDYLFVPDTLWSYSFNIKGAEDSLLIPDSVFAQANIEYTLKVAMQNSENERTDLDEWVNFYQKRDVIELKSENDGIHISVVADDARKVHVTANDNFGFKLLDTLVNAPCILPNNTFVSVYNASTENSHEKLQMFVTSSGIHVNANRSRDSIFFSLQNPKEIAVVYYLTEEGHLIKSGTTNHFPFAIAAKDKDSYYLKVQYLWAGKNQFANVYVPTTVNTVKFNVEKPNVITPGKEVDIKITATDYNDKPIKDLNLLAYSYTQKFGDADIAELPYSGLISNNTYELNSFKINEGNKSNSTTLQYSFWNKELQLDTNWAYRFRYPSKNKIGFTYIHREDSITQMAPFIMENGAPKPIQYVIIDHIPVYFGFTSRRTAYSFAVDSNYHQIAIRTSDKLLTMDSLKVAPFVKTIFSIDQNNAPASVSVKEMPGIFTKEERPNLIPFIMDLDMPREYDKYTYLERLQDDAQYIDLNKNDRSSGGSSIGPVYWRYWSFNINKGFRRSFEYEPYYTYSFQDDLVKMKSNGYEKPFYLPMSNIVPDINDVYLTKDILLAKYAAELKEKRKNYFPEIKNNYFNGTGELTISYDESLGKYMPLNIVLGRPGDFNFINIYPGKTTDFSHLAPGKYQLLLLNDSLNYRQTSVIEIKPYGHNFYRINPTDSVKIINRDMLDTTIENMYLPDITKRENNLGVLMKAYTALTYKGITDHYSGTVLDKHKNVIPGAIVRLSNTSIATMTDVDGKFEIGIPVDLDPLLNISSIGLIGQNFKATKNMTVVLDQNDNTLQEVVVKMSYGPAITKSKYVGAADVITTSYEHGYVNKMSIQALEGAAAGVQVTNGGGQPGSGASLMIRGMGTLNGNTSPLYVIDGAIYNGDLTSLDPSLVESMTILKDATSTSLYGSRGSNGVVVITTKKGAVLPDKIKAGLQTLPPPMTEDMMVSGLRHNFRDDAYWQPDLVTDENGKVSFKVKFPDDITNWRTFLFATDNKKHTGAVISNIKSYKPVAASLYLPHFLLVGDTAMLIGKSVNYIPDTIAATTTFFRNDTLQKENKIKLGTFYNDTLMVTATHTDSLKLKYLLTKEDGYFDGEEKTIPVHPVGVKIAEGAFMPLDMKDTAFIVYPTHKTDTLHINATASLIDVVLDEVNVLRDYGYLCNEQMASKIMGMLAKERIYKSLHKTFDTKDKDYVQDLIRKLTKNQNNHQQWGWWNDGVTVQWISTHVMHALMKAKEMGYNCNINLKPITDAYIYDLERDTTHTNIAMLQTLADNKVVLNYEKYISRLERQKNVSLNDYLELVLLRQQLHLPYKTERLKSLQESDIYGNIYWKDTTHYVYQNEVISTINALKIIGQDSSIHINKNKIVNWLMQQRGNNGWRNTYESAQIIEAIAPLIPVGDSAAMQPSLHFSGGMEAAVTSFPYRKNILLNAPVQISKQGATTVYFTYYYNKWDTTNTNLGHAFKVQSGFKANGKNISYLPAGQPVTMNVNIQADKSADFIMIEIPIPAGCSYREKDQSYANYEIHREYFEDKVSIFCEKLPKGNYNFEIELLPRYEGNYTLNPAKAELMYFPVFYGRDLVKKVEIKEGK